jgi:uncharacterized SAM-binding protein YcdF (DUF218 family)
MFVFFSKFLPPLISPLGLAILLLLCGFLFNRRHPRLRTFLQVTALVILLLASNRWVAYSFARTLEWQYLPEDNIPTAEVIVLLGGSTEPAQSPRPQVEVNSAGDRVLYAAALYSQNKAPIILASGGNITWLEDRLSSQAGDMAELLVTLGVPPDAIWLEETSRNTYENAEYCAELLKKKGISQIILVTSAMHMPRSVALFRYQGINPIPAPTDFTITHSGWSELTSTPSAVLVNMVPSASSLSLTTNILKEYIGLMIYHLSGWL